MIVSSVCIKQRHLKIERMFTIPTRAFSWALSGIGKEAEGLDNRYCVKFMKFGIALSTPDVSIEIKSRFSSYQTRQ